MSFVRVGHLIVNLMAVSAAKYNPNPSPAFERRLTVNVIGVPEPLEFFGEEADMVWRKLVHASTSVEELY